MCYIIRGERDFHYCGITTQIEKRIEQHNSGKGISTRKNVPYVILYTEIFESMKLARIREKQIKNYGVKRWYLKNIVFSVRRYASV